VKGDHHEFLPRGQTVNKEYYTEVIKRLREVVGKKKARCLFAILVMHETTFVPQLPRLAQADILLFPKQEFTLKGCLEPVENIQEN
jgi:hypothetical protein